MLDPSNQKPYFTLCLSVQGKRCLVVGGGEVARRRASSLVDSGAKLTVISPTLDSVLEYMAFQHEITWKQSEFKKNDISDDTYLVVAATDKRETNKEIGEICQRKGMLCNIVDEPTEGNFIVPSSLERGPLSISVSTSGISPALAATIRQELELAYGEEYGTFLELLASLRPVVMQEFDDIKIRQTIFRRMVASRALELIQAGMTDDAHHELNEIIFEAKRDPSLGA